MAWLEHDRQPREYLYSSLEDLRIDSVTVTDRELGRGAYGVISAVEYKGAVCAGKQLHSVFFHGTKSDHKRLLLERFVEECRFHSRQRHPNIVQLLGVYFQPATVLPMLVMELLDMSLQHFLEGYEDVPAGVKNRILLDVSLGLLHLHSQMVVHRDLTASNVLLTSSLTAKITDLGMARIIDPRVIARQRQELTVVPGAQAAMAPEACTANAVYNYKLDVFSFGVLVLQVHTQVFPHPDEALYRIDSSQPTGRATLTAIERRRTYIDMLEGNNAIHSLVLRCLSDDPDMRPTTSSLVQEMKISCHANPPPPTNALLLVKKLNSCEEKVEKLKAEVEEERRLVLSCKLQLKTKEEELEKQSRVVESLSKANSTLYQMISTKVRRREKPSTNPGGRAVARGGICSQGFGLSASCNLTSFMEQGHHNEAYPNSSQRPRSGSALRRNRQWRVWDMNGESLIDVNPKTPTIDEELEGSLKISTNTCAPLPIPLYNAQGVLLKGQVYIGGYQQSGKSYATDIYHYAPVDDKWDLFTCAPTCLFALAVFKNHLTVVGGVSPESELCSNVVHMLEDVDAMEKTWNALAETMSYERKCGVATGFATYLIVAGGVDKGGKVIDVVEIYHADLSQWHIVIPTSPWKGRAHISTTFAQASWYLLGGEGEEGSASELLHRFPLTLLLENLSSNQIVTSPWKKLPSAINTHSAIGLLNGNVITVGGSSPVHHAPSALIHCLSTDEYHWERVGWLPKAVEKAAAVNISKNCLLVVGGLMGIDSDMSIPTASVRKLTTS